MKRSLILGVFALFVSSSTNALEKVYGVAAAGYADAEVDSVSAKDLSYRFSVGYRYHRQWNIELSYQHLVDDTGDMPNTTLQADAVSLSALGKAANRSGELYYRVGLASVSLTAQTNADEMGLCELGSAVGAVNDAGAICVVDDSVVAAIVGLGFDWHLGLNTMLRFEGEYMAGEDEFSNGAVYLGLRYNFN